VDVRTGSDPAPSGPWRVVGVGLALALLALAFRNVGGARALQRALAVGAGLPLLLLPSTLGTLLDVVGWRLLLARVGVRPAWLGLARVRLSADALLLGLPFGTVVSESATPALLGRLCGLALPDALAAMAARRCLLALSNALYLASGALVAIVVLRKSGVSEAMPLQWVLLTLALVLLGSAALATAWPRNGGAGQRVLDLLQRLPAPRLRRWLDRHACTFHTTDERLGRVLGPRGSLALPLVVYLGSGLAEALEAALLLGLLHSGLGFSPGTPARVGALRGARARRFRPRGARRPGRRLRAGARRHGDGRRADHALTTAAAFTLLRRSKEACWIGLGLLVMPGRLRPSFPSASWRAPDAA
jgi:hypothetical protein